MTRILVALGMTLCATAFADGSATGQVTKLIVPLAEVAQTQGVLNREALPAKPARGPVLLVPSGWPEYMLDYRLKTPAGNVPLRDEFVPKLAILLGRIAQELAAKHGQPPDIIALAETPAQFLPGQLEMCASALQEVLKAQGMPAVKVAIPVQGGWQVGDEPVIERLEQP